MISFGNVLGRRAYIQVEDTKHFTNEFMVKVGESSRSRKGTGKNRIRAIMEQVDPEWLQTSQCFWHWQRRGHHSS